MTKYRAIIFDLDGVVLAPSSFARQLQSMYGISPEMTAPFFRGPFKSCQAGCAQIQDELLPFLEQWQWKGSVQDFVAFWYDCDSVVNLKLLTFIQDMRSRGVRCLAASNQESARIGYLQQRLHLSKYFEQLLFSAHLHALKPTVAFFAACTQLLKLAPADILFWDDAADVVSAARAYGWHANNYTTFEHFEATMAQFAVTDGILHLHTLNE